MKLGDVKEINKLLHHSHYDVVTCNPPYFETLPTAIQNTNEHFTIARHEVLCTLEDTVQAASYLLKQGGKAAFVHRPGRLMDILSLMRKHRLEPKRMRLVYPRPGKEANTLLIEGIKDGKPDLKILPPLFVYNEDSEYSPEVHEMLYGKE
jgi:tRNA1(Val) A37 N6-methylase TrmN6